MPSMSMRKQTQRQERISRALETDCPPLVDGPGDGGCRAAVDRVDERAGVAVAGGPAPIGVGGDGSGQWLVVVVVIDSGGVGRMVLRKTLVVPEDNRRQESTLSYHGCDIVNADELCGRRQTWCQPGRGMIVFNLVFPSWGVCG
ncbi:predicted protein [Histoplasma capsulatum H143]|uniref:Uncharacterized protein n=1 Tax=Ajellomyces capsulatus (strain H143) TaxID=544712 RepID=C6HJJ3_AJECH|nr:predicted protein [Histoplasma capsulatum H143]